LAKNSSTENFKQGKMPMARVYWWSEGGSGPFFMTSTVIKRSRIPPLHHIAKYADFYE